MFKCSQADEQVECDLRWPDRERVINGRMAPSAGGLGELQRLNQTLRDFGINVRTSWLFKVNVFNIFFQGIIYEIFRAGNA